MKHRLQNRLQVTMDDRLRTAIGNGWNAPRPRTIKNDAAGGKRKQIIASRIPQHNEPAK